jgi:demethylspheroidene O-methyltransferase
MVALAATGGWLDGLFNWRNGLLASPRFQRWAAGFPLTRRIARREARALFDLCAGFVYAQVLAACVELDLFEALAAGPLSVKALALRGGLPEASMLLLLQAAVSLRLLEDAGGGAKYRLGRLGAALRGNPGIAAMVRHHRLFYADLADPLALLRGGQETSLGKFWPYAGSGGQAAEYSALMAASQPLISREILDRYDFAQHHTMLDLGGGDGSFLCAVGARAPDLRLQLMDLPDVTAQAGPRFAQAGIAARAQIFSGSFLDDALPRGADLVTLIRVLHDHGDESALKILKAARETLPPGGTLLLAEPLAGTESAEPVGDAYFSFYLLAMGSGRPRRFTEIATLLEQAGFIRIQNIATRQKMLTGLVTARVPHG